MKKTRLVLAALLALALLIVAVGLCLPKDAPPPQVDDLRVQRLEIPREENAFTWFELAAEELWWPEDEAQEERLLAALGGKGWDDGPVTELLERNARALKDWGRGLACSVCQVPEFTTYDALVPYWSSWGQLARVTCLRALRLSRQGRAEEALDALMQVVRFGQMIEGSKGAIIHYLVGLSVKTIALKQLREVGTGEGCEPRVLVSVARELGGYRANVEALKDAFALQYVAAGNAIDDVANREWRLFELSGESLPLRERILPRYFFQPNRTRALYARVLRAYIRNLPCRYAQVDLSDLPQFPEPVTFWEKVGAFLRPNAGGEALVAFLEPSGERMIEEKCNENVNVAATQLVLALGAFERENGHLPASLDELVPRYLESVPLDDFDGKPMRYSRKARIVYSVGRDLIDSGGSTGEDSWEMDEPSFSIGAPVPARPTAQPVPSAAPAGGSG